MRKPIKIYVLIFIIFTLINVALFRYLDNQSSVKYNDLYSLYQQKNDSAFVYLAEHAFETIPLADTLMAISESKENEDPAKIRQLIDKAKIQAEEIDDQLSTFIEFSDAYINNAVPKHFVNNTAMTTDEQLDMFILAREARIWWSLYDISYSYWKSNPKTIDTKTRDTLRLLATELYELNKTITSFKDIDATHMFYLAENYKALMLGNLKPHLERLKKIQDDFSGHK
ncbi:hypothetical protein [Paenibacillus endoradicis]|uniref:hypothetical protein n=1 Tax=Paenibacillus endoradicis TaxID=2972487 RepID=UPI00215978A8|nr:hypothetical protein [Paenibacillus endoradicis]MCR8656750.1 hypothetical protein [Paenibacillus endoradicis]